MKHFSDMFVTLCGAFENSGIAFFEKNPYDGSFKSDQSNERAVRLSQNHLDIIIIIILSERDKAQQHSSVEETLPVLN